MLAEQVDVVIGVDTHRDTHALAVVGARTGELLYEFSIDADPAGYRRALPGPRPWAGARTWAVEGGAYGAGLRRPPCEAGERVIEVGRPARTARSQPAKDPTPSMRCAPPASVLAGPGRPSRAPTGPARCCGS